MERYRNIIFYIVIAILSINAIWSHYKISNLEKTLESVTESTKTEIYLMRHEINNIHNSVEERLKKEASLVSHYNLTFGKINTDTHTVDANLSLTPKEISSNIELHLDYRGENYSFTRENDVFKVSFPAYLFTTYKDNEYPILKIENGSSTKLEQLNYLDVNDLYAKYLPTLLSPDYWQVQFIDGKASIQIDHKHPFIPYSEDEQTKEFTKFYIRSEVNGKATIHPLAPTKLEYSSDIALQDTFEINATENDELYITFEAIDQLGYIHSVDMYNLDKDLQERSIQDQNRNVLICMNN